MGGEGEQLKLVEHRSIELLRARYYCISFVRSPEIVLFTSNVVCKKKVKLKRILFDRASVRFLKGEITGHNNYTTSVRAYLYVPRTHHRVVDIRPRLHPTACCCRRLKFDEGKARFGANSRATFASYIRTQYYIRNLWDMTITSPWPVRWIRRYDARTISTIPFSAQTVIKSLRLVWIRIDDNNEKNTTMKRERGEMSSGTGREEWKYDETTRRATLRRDDDGRTTKTTPPPL